jgi:STE24 endopeptidase
MTAIRLVKTGTLVLAAAAWIVAAALLWRTKVPDDLALPHLQAASFFGDAQRHRAEHYDAISRLLYLAALATELAVLVTLTVFARRLARAFALGEIGAGVMIAVAANLFLWAAALPLNVLGLWWDHRYGLSKRDYWSFIGAQVGGLLVQTAVVATVLAVIMLIARAFRRRWWLVVAPLFVAVGGGLVMLFAVVSQVGTHRIRDPEVRVVVRQLQQREGVPDTKIRVDDVSDDTTAVNAMTTGLGPTTVVILWNTLFRAGLSDRAVEFVTAHELGHAARRHIWKGLGWGLLFSLPLTYLLADVTRRRGGIHQAHVVPFALLVSAVLGVVSTPLQNVVSRRYEAEADWMALRATHDPGAGREAFRSFTRVDLADPSPPLWSYLLLDTHPTVMQRLAMTKAWEARNPRAARPSPAGS